VSAARPRELGIPFDGEPGPLNAITDVPGVEVGFTTLVRGDGPLKLGQGPVRTGVTAVLPRGRDGVGRACAAGWHALNGNGEMTGTTWIEESGGLSMPVLITNTHAVAALDAARGGPVAEGAVGGGTGMTCYAFKGGSGTSSRRVAFGDDVYTVAVFVQENTDWLAPPGAGSVIGVVATDAPLLPGQCKALARRVPLGLARTGTAGSHFSGDIFLAFSTANDDALTSRLMRGGPEYASLRFIPWELIDPFHEAVVQAAEEAVVCALVAGETTVGIDGHRSPGLPNEQVAALFAARG
jgi:D-aminopeptidase